MIDNPQLGTINLGVGLFPFFMGTFDYPPPANDVWFISAIPDQPKATIFLVASFKMSYFDDLLIFPSPLDLMEWVWNLGMAMPLSATKVVYKIVQQASTNPDLAPTQELDPILEPVWAQDSRHLRSPRLSFSL
jgi:hypothetical protein